jgi:hypothetical protein
MPAILPVLRTAPPPQPQYPVGTRVRLAACPSGEPGVVRGTHRGKVHVFWSDLHIIGRHKAETLVVA